MMLLYFCDSKHLITFVCNISLALNLIQRLQCFDTVGWVARRASGL